MLRFDSNTLYVNPIPCRDEKTRINFPREKNDSENDENDSQNEGEEPGATYQQFLLGPMFCFRVPIGKSVRILP